MIMSLDSLELKNLHYQKTILKDFLRALYGGVANNPTKSMAFLVTDNEPKTGYEIIKDIYEECFDCDENGLEYLDLRKINSSSIKNYFEKAIIKLSKFVEKRREIGKTNSSKRKYEYFYFKNPKGFIFGDPAAYLCIEASSDDNYSSTYKTFGTANTSRDSDSQTTTIILLRYLIERGPSAYKLHDVIDDIFGFEGKRRSKEYRNLKDKMLYTIIRLNESKILTYNSRKPEEEIIYTTTKTKTDIQEDIKRLRKMGYSENSIIPYKCYCEKILKKLNGKELTTKEIAKELGLESCSHIQRTLSMLRKLSHIEVVEGKIPEDFGIIEVSKKTLNYYDKYLKRILKASGLEDAIDKVNGIKYEALNQTVQPNVNEFLKMREEFINPIVFDKSMRKKFQDMCIKARRKHVEESGHIKKH